MRRIITIAPLLLALLSHAQQDIFRSKISVQAGLVRSLGDITSGLETFDPERTAMLGLSYEHFLGYGVSLYGGYEYVRLSGNDRESGRLDRSLNFLTEVNTAQLGLRLYADNGRLLNYDARFAPFIQVGFGAGMYDAYGDLYDRDGKRYNYWSDGTIRTVPEGSPDAANAQMTVQDGKFETRLTDLATEKGKPGETWFMFIPARVGVKWRICDRFSAELAYAFNWTFTDHLDDVSSDYPRSFTTEELAYISNPSGYSGTRGGNDLNDHFHHLSLGISVGLGRRAHRYRMPPIRTLAAVSATVESAVAFPDTMPSATIAPAKKDSLPEKWTINVESIRIARLEVDTLVVRGQTRLRADTARKSTTPSDTMARAIPLVPDSSRRDTTIAVRADTLQPGIGSDTLRERSQLDTLEQRSPGDTLRTTLSNDTVKVTSAADTLGQPTAADTLNTRARSEISPVKALADTLQRRTVGIPLRT